MSTGKKTTDIDTHVARRIRAARVEAGLSQEEVGKAIGVTFQQAQKYENGANRVSAGQLMKIARKLKKPIGWFFDGAPGGIAEDQEFDLVAEFLCKPHARDMARSFIKLDGRSRQAILQLTATMASHGIAGAQ